MKLSYDNWCMVIAFAIFFILIIFTLTSKYFWYFIGEEIKDDSLE